MRPSFFLCTLALPLGACLDFALLQSGTNQTDLATTNPDLTSPAADLSMPAPPDMTAPPTTWVKTYNSTGTKLYAISGLASATDSIYVVGEAGRVFGGSGGTFTKLSFDAGSGALTSLWLAGASEIWLASADGFVLRSTDAGSTNWVDQSASAPYSLKGIYGKSNSDVVVMGANSSNGLSGKPSPNWMNAPHGTSKNVNGIWASATKYYVVGLNGTAASAADPRGTWTQIAPLPGNDLTAISGVDDATVFAVTNTGKLLKYASGANSWTTLLSLPGAPALNAVFVKSATEIWVAGNSASVYRCDSTTPACVNESNSNLGNATLTGVWSSSRGTWVVGYSGADGAIFKY